MPVFTLCSTIEGWWWFCSSSLKCAQQLSFILKTHCAFFRWNNIFLGHCFFSSNTGYCIFRHLSTTKNFITKVRFSLILLCLPSISRDCGDQADGDEGSWQTPFFTERHTSCGICLLQAPKCFYRRLRHEASFCRIDTRGFRCGVESLAVTKHLWTF